MSEINSKQLSVRISEALHIKMKAWCVENRTKVQDFVIEALKEYLEKKQSAKD